MKESRYLSPEEEPLSLAELELESSPQAASIIVDAIVAIVILFLKRFICFPFCYSVNLILVAKARPGLDSPYLSYTRTSMKLRTSKFQERVLARMEYSTPKS